MSNTSSVARDTISEAKGAAHDIGKAARGVGRRS